MSMRFRERGKIAQRESVCPADHQHTGRKRDGLAWQNPDGTWGWSYWREDSARDRTGL